MYKNSNALRKRESKRQAVVIDINDLQKIKNIKEKRKEKSQRLKNLKLTFKLSFALAIVFAVFLALLSTSAIIKGQQNNIADLRNEAKVLQEQNSRLKSEVASALDLDYVEEFARNKLNMSEPMPHQIIYIDVPKENYSVAYENIEEEDSKLKKVFASIKND